MDLLKRSLAPVLPEAWDQVDEEAKRVLKLHLAGRKLVDFSGPHAVEVPPPSTRGDSSSTRRARAMCPPLFAWCSLSSRSAYPLHAEDDGALTSARRGANDLDLDPVIAAAERVARAEDTQPSSTVTKRAASPASSKRARMRPSRSGLQPLRLAPRHRPSEGDAARRRGVNGPYALALGIKAYSELVSDSEDACYPLRKRIERVLIDGPFVLGRRRSTVVRCCSIDPRAAITSSRRWGRIYPSDMCRTRARRRSSSISPEVVHLPRPRREDSLRCSCAAVHQPEDIAGLQRGAHRVPSMCAFSVCLRSASVGR